MTIKKMTAAAALAGLTVAAAATTTSTPAQANEAVAAGIGFVAGAIVGNAVSQPRVYHTAPRTVVVHGGLQPWTPAWYSYCSQRYRSFNPNTGYFLAYSGNYVFCQ